jgi:hypothetical protein
MRESAAGARLHNTAAAESPSKFLFLSHFAPAVARRRVQIASDARLGPRLRILQLAGGVRPSQASARWHPEGAMNRMMVAARRLTPISGQAKMNEKYYEDSGRPERKRERGEVENAEAAEHAHDTGRRSPL